MNLRRQLSASLGLVLLTAASQLGARTLELFVAPEGRDANPGTKAKPFATLEAARDAIRTRKSTSEPPRDGVTVWLRGGDFVRTNAFALTAADSGTPESPIVYRAYRRERVRLLGGRVLSGFRPVTDPAVRARLDEAARPHVVQLDLRALGITDFGELKSRGFGRPTTPAHAELFYDGRPMTLARWPNEGEWERIAGYPDASGGKDEHGGSLGALAGGFFYAGDRPRRWKDTSDLWVHGYWSWDWANSYERVAALDPDQHLVKTAPPYGQYGFRKGQRFYFLNVLEELDQPGEWFLDRKSGILYFWLPPSSAGVSPATETNLPAGRQRQPEILLSLLDQPLLKLTGVSNVTFRGLALEAARGDAVEIYGGASNRIAGCLIRDIGDYGVQIEGGRGHGVVSCDIFDTGDGGVSLSGGDRRTLTPAGHFVENCHFARQGRWSKCYVPAVLVNGVGQRVAHNLIHDHPHCAILFGGNDHLIEFNEIYHVALETGDVGAIYAGRDWTYRGNQIRYNFVHDTGGVGMGSMGVYMDDCVSGTEIFGNIFYKVQRAAFLGGGRDHHVINNVFVDCNPAVQVDGRGLDHSPVWHNMVYDFMRQHLADVPQELYRRRYPALINLDRYYASTNGVPPEGNVVAHNVCVGKWLEVGWHADRKMLDVRDNCVGVDPGFVAPGTMDFRLKKDSPAWRLGFQRIPTEQIGLRNDEDRRALDRSEDAGVTR